MDLSLFATSETKQLLQGLHGLEKESLRVNPDGSLALTPHPKGLGSPLTHPQITTDFSESQVEMITAPFHEIDQTLEALESLHREVYENLENGEMLWPMSMPCVLPKPELIPIARYGDSPEGQVRERYRQGLSSRYGKTMQMISGVHYNFSFNPELWPFLAKIAGEKNVDAFKNQAYMNVIQNFLRYRWIFVYLFAASPEKDPSYQCALMNVDVSEAISLRLSRCGYSNPAKIDVSFQNFDQHVRDIRTATETPYNPYANIPVQLNDHLLQLANEYYASIRVKPPSLQGSLLESLETQGAGYLEVRILDLYPFSPIGVDKSQLEFLHLLLSFCLLEENSPLRPVEAIEANDRQQKVAIEGQDLPMVLREEAELLLQRMKPLAEILGKQELLEKWRHEVLQPTDRPWQRILAEEAKDGDSFLDFGLRKAQEYFIHFRP